MNFQQRMNNQSKIYLLFKCINRWCLQDYSGTLFRQSGWGHLNRCFLNAVLSYCEPQLPENVQIFPSAGFVWLIHLQQRTILAANLSSSGPSHVALFFTNDEEHNNKSQFMIMYVSAMHADLVNMTLHTENFRYKMLVAMLTVVFAA